MEVGLPLRGVCEQGELGDAEDLAFDVLDALLPHSARCVVGEDLEGETEFVRYEFEMCRSLVS